MFSKSWSGGIFIWRNCLERQPFRTARQYTDSSRSTHERRLFLSGFRARSTTRWRRSTVCRWLPWLYRRWQKNFLEIGYRLLAIRRAAWLPIQSDRSLSKNAFLVKKRKTAGANLPHSRSRTAMSRWRRVKNGYRGRILRYPNATHRWRSLAPNHAGSGWRYLHNFSVYLGPAISPLKTWLLILKRHTSIFDQKMPLIFYDINQYIIDKSTRIFYKVDCMMQSSVVLLERNKCN